MSWIKIEARFDQTPQDWAPYIEIFRDHGCENTLQEDNPPSLWAAVVDVSGSDKVVSAIRAAMLAEGVKSVEDSILPEENWEENWKRHFKPRRVGKSIFVRPTWESVDIPAGAVEIVLDPGQAFGTGDHPTTRMCLELIEEFVRPGDAVADIGCGSGILSVGARKLGAGRVLATDIDPLSVEVAKENAQLNGVEFEAVVSTGASSLPSSRWPTPDSTQYDVVVSNIISATLIAIARDVSPVVRPGGHWIVSGIILANWEDVRAAAESAGFRLVRELEEGDWVGAALAKAG
jgi:ribosomal protein L11 methyltransferase